MSNEKLEMKMKNEKLISLRKRLMTMRTLMKMLCIAFLISHFSLLISSCARMGSPDGGWFDDDPPRVLYSIPAEQATNVTDQKMTIYFDEFIKLADPTQNVIVSPPQMEMPEIQAKGKKIVIALKDSLVPNTTYTIDFSDAITDNNEDNPLGNYTYTFSTGEQIDTFEVAGTVLDASNLEPVKGISVGLYADLADSAFLTKPLLRIARTDGRGHFSIRGVAPGVYRVYALQDMDANYKFSQKSEMIAFSHETYTPSSKPDTRQDTIWRDSLHIDNILQVPYTHFYPDDIVMLAFKEIQSDRYLLKTERKDPDRIGVFFSYGNEQLPVLRGLNFNADSAFIWAEQFDGGGWHLPTKEEMTTIRKYKNLVNSTLERKGYNTILTNHTFYWTGTPCSESHTYACGPDGIKCYFNQNLSSCYRARAVKRIDKQI